MASDMNVTPARLQQAGEVKYLELLIFHMRTGALGDWLFNRLFNPITIDQYNNMQAEHDRTIVRNFIL